MFKSTITEATVRQWWADYQRLKSFTKTAAVHGVSQGTVHTRLRQLGLITVTPRSRELAPEKVEAMVADYRRYGSLAKVADKHKRTRQAVWEVLSRRGLTLPPKPRNPDCVEHRGERFTPDCQGFYRSTCYASRQKGQYRLLHRVLWEEAHGPIPKGRMIIFKDGDRAHCALENLQMVTRQEARKMFYTGNGWTKWREANDRLVAELQAALASGDAGRIARAQSEYDALKPPATHSPERRKAWSKLMKEQWAKLTPAERLARGRKAGETRKRHRHERLGTALERMVGA